MQPPEASRANVLIWLVAAALAVVALTRLTGSDRDPAPVRIERSPGSERAAAGGRGGPQIYVHVAGAVRHPDLLRLPEGSRVADALERAGGPGRRADLAGVNLAARLEDGQQVIVPVRGAAGPASVAGAAAGLAGSAAPGAAGVPKLGLGVATVEQLDQIDGIGPTLAQRIVEYRGAHGGFRSLAELRDVEGIGEKRFETLRDALQP